MDSHSQPLNLDSIRSQIEELTTFLKEDPSKNSSLSPSESQQLLQECLQAFQTKVKQIESDHSDIGHFNDEDLDAYTDRLRLELKLMEADNASVSKEIEDLTQSYVEGTCELERNLVSLRHIVDSIESKGLGQAESRDHVDNFHQGEDHPKLLKADNDRFEVMDLKNKIENNNMTLKKLQDLELNLKRVELVEKIEEALTGLKVIDFEDNCIRVSLRTYIPNAEGWVCQLKAENNINLSEVNHELLIEVKDGTMQLKNAEIFPNDVYLGDIVEAANNFSKLFSTLLVLETRSSLGWFLHKVQDKIVTCTVRQVMVKNANESTRHSIEYLDKDELVVAHMVGGIDAFIKPSQGWPLSTSTLKLVSLRCSDQNAKEISLSLLCKVEEVANSLDDDVRRSITDFLDGIEAILLEKMHTELHFDSITQRV